MAFLLPQAQRTFLRTRLPRFGYTDLKEYETDKNPAWVDLKQKKFEKTPPGHYRCVDCGVTHGLQVHHVTYEHVCEERDEELVYVCKKHHEARHAEWTRIAMAERNQEAPPLGGRAHPTWNLIARIMHFVFFY